MTGHLSSARFRKSGPLCHVPSSPMSSGFLPLVKRSAMLYLLSIQYQFSGFVPSCISRILVAANVLNPYELFGIIACTI